MKFTLKNGEGVEIREITKAISPKQVLNFYAPIISEKPEPFLKSDRAPTLKEEKQWLKKKFKAIAKKQEVTLIALSGKNIVGMCDGRKQDRRNRDKVSIGIVIAKKYRGLGLGKKLLAETVKLVKKLLKPKIIYLTAIGVNKPARALYNKLGFEEIAVLPKWIKVRGKYQDEIYMKLK